NPYVRPTETRASQTQASFVESESPTQRRARQTLQRRSTAEAGANESIRPRRQGGVNPALVRRGNRQVGGLYNRHTAVTDEVFAEWDR
ncbi:MAG: hypothetical protein KDA60_20935, partial [Planctomycetales bacterium]|nr:hypothetical protein [Planctomycetales bacterium]